ncbi:prolyl oligopeptidase [Photobacterium aquae]|uniref:Prolyl oligopeptidase n=1 Tax=Photobacterium aquae TaxID=1195763 RepID=A0A0J1JN98_9GAMM|nr:prolyl oligopeptidase family serine peptidase [Photobacterium aquae]KLV03707.1 prolyl oligopeptidase [Photobacterium aquae]
MGTYKTLLAASIAMLGAGGAVSAEQDPFLWLEEVESEQALSWVKQQNGVTQAYLQKGDNYQQVFEDSLAILNAEDKLAYPRLLGGYYYNFWQDSDHVKGIYRRTSPEEYRKPNPKWETVIDVDALAKAEKTDWVYKGMECLEPDNTRCLVSLSRGGADATVVREFDLSSKRFVTDGFVLPEAKSQVSWFDHNHLLVATDYGEGSLTDSGYPRQVKLWRRDTQLAEAKPLYEGAVESVSASGYTLHDRHGQIALIREGTSFYTSKNFLLDEKQQLHALAIPDDATVGGYFDGKLFFQLKSDTENYGQTLVQGSIVYAPVDELIKEKPRYQKFVAPTPHASIEGLHFTANHILVTWLEDVTSKLAIYSPAKDGGWQAKQLPLGDNGSLYAFNANSQSDHFFIDYSSFLLPASIYDVDAETAQVSLLKSAPAKFAADDMVSEQFFATSKDGTKVPYFVIHKKALKLDGNNPTLLYGYGGFEVSLTPYYSAIIGKNWLEKGGVYVLANIRGGGEYGPAWHRAALKHHRHKAYEDFEAIAEDLIARKITSPAHLGIQGGSNGGLLMGAAVTRRPDLYNAVVCQVPLLDMKRFHKLLAGASWMAEYGDPDLASDWDYLKTYSPYHNVHKETAYPKVLFTTSTRDDRVHPAHARKMVALMQAQGHDVLYYENLEGGHAGASNNNTRAEMYSQIYSYLYDRLM